MSLDHPATALPSQTETPQIATKGDLEIAPGALVRESLRTDGRLLIGAGATVEGSASSTQDAEVGEGAQIGGTLLVAGSLRWGNAARASRAAIGGPLITEDGTTRALSVTATRGIHPALPEGASA